MPATDSSRYYVRRKTGSPIGPFSELALTTMLKRGTFNGSEEISPDQRSWRSISELSNAEPQRADPPRIEPLRREAPPTLSPAPAAPVRLTMPLSSLSLPLSPAPAAAAASSIDDDPGFLAEGTEVLDVPPGGLPMDDIPFHRVGVELDRAPAPKVDLAARLRGGPGGARRPLGPPPMAVTATAAAVAVASAPEPAGAAALELDVDDLMPLELAPLELDRREPASGPALRALAGRDPDAPVSDLISEEESRGFETQGSVPLLPTVQEDVTAANVANPAGASPTPSQPRHRTMSAVRRTAAIAPPARRHPRKALIAAAAVLVVGAAAAALALDVRRLFVQEPKVAAVLAPAAAEIEQDSYPAYEQGARLLTDAVASHPKSAKLRAAAAELLASSVVLRRAERARLGRADAILAEVTAPSEIGPEVKRARAWIALGKGNVKDAGRLASGGADDPDWLLLAGAIQMAEGRADEAARTFERAAAAFPSRVALRYALGRAQEWSGDMAAAAASYKAVLAQSKAHLGAAIAAIRTGDFPPASRRALVDGVIAKLATAGSRAELADAHLLVGRNARQQGQMEASDAAYKRALAVDPGHAATLVATGEALLDEGKIKDAVAKLEAATVTVPAALPPAAVPRDLRIAMAAVLIEKGKTPEGLALLDPPAPAPATNAAAASAPAVKAAPDARVLFWRARAAELGATGGDLGPARRGYEEALKVDPRFVPATLRLAAILTEEHRGADGLAVLRRAEAAGVPAAALQLALGEALLVSGDVERARQTFEDALAANPQLGAARMGLASALQAGGDGSGAKGQLDTLLAQAPETPGLRQRMAELLVSQGHKDQALATYQAEIATGKAPAALKVAAARLALDSGHVDVAQQILEKLSAEAPETPGALLLLGRALRANGDLHGAVTELRRALAFEGSPELHYEYGRVLLESGNPEEAQGELEQAPALPAAMIERARLSLRRGDAERALGPLEAAVKLAPTNADGWLLLGNAYDRLGLPAKAEAAWKSAVRTDGTLPEPHYRLGRLQMDQGLPGAALVQLRLAAPKVPPAAVWTADFYFQLGFAEKAKGSRAAALGALKKYLTLAPSDAPSRREVERVLGSLAN
jgi:tetratricopeptide (TPR) repeat protein